MGKLLYHHSLKPKQKNRKNLNKRRILVRKHASLLRYGFVVVIFGTLAVVFYSLTQKRYFSVNTINVAGTRSFVNKDDLHTMASQQLSGRYIFELNPKAIEDILLNTFQGAKEIKVMKDWPDEVNIEVVERTPLALIVVPMEENSYLIDEDGYVLGIVDESKTNLPQINYHGEVRVGQFLDKSLVPLYLELLSSIDEKNLKASSVSVNDEYINFYLENKINVLIGKSKDIKRSVVIISELKKQLEYEGKPVKKIDLRYDKVVVE